MKPGTIIYLQSAKGSSNSLPNKITLRTILYSNRWIILIIALSLGICFTYYKNQHQTPPPQVDLRLMRLREIMSDAEKNDAMAQFILGKMYESGHDVTQNNIEAYKWLNLSAAQNWETKEMGKPAKEARENLESLMSEKEIKQGKRSAASFVDRKQSLDRESCPVSDFQEVKAKAERGDSEAQFRLAIIYYNGFGVVRNESEALRWCMKAANQGDVPAQLTLAGKYYRGDGVAPNSTEAILWWRKAAEQGSATAEAALGVMYHNGDGVSQNYVEAYKWFNLSAQHGRKQSLIDQKKTEALMTPNQIAEANRQVIALLARH